MSLRNFLDRLLNLPTVHEEQDAIDSRARQVAIERRQREIMRRLDLLAIEERLIRREGDEGRN